MTKDTNLILQNKYLPIYEVSFGLKILRDDCTLNPHLSHDTTVKNQTLIYGIFFDNLMPLFDVFASAATLSTLFLLNISMYM